jgi:hypothetical protein
MPGFILGHGVIARLDLARRGDPGRIQSVVATLGVWLTRRNSSRVSAGVFQPRVFRGPGVKCEGYGLKIIGVMYAEIGAFWKVLA